MGLEYLVSAALFVVLYIAMVVSDNFSYIWVAVSYLQSYLEDKNHLLAYWTAHSLQWHWSSTVAVILGAQQYRSILGRSSHLIQGAMKVFIQIEILGN